MKVAGDCRIYKNFGILILRDGWMSRLKNIKLGTCTWNYDSWVGLVYSSEKRYASDYLTEYSKQFETAEIDSWFYHMPSSRECIEYKKSAGNELRFTCKVPQQITLTHHRQKSKNDPLEANPDFLSVPLFEDFLGQIEPLMDSMDAVMLEFEYLNKDKMESPEKFLEYLEKFLSKIPHGVPIAVETRNGNYLKKPYYQFIRDHQVIHVFSEKLYMPQIYTYYKDIRDYLSGSTVIRLMGGDRKKIEKETGNRWDRVVFPQSDLEDIADMIKELSRSLEVTVNVNNHYEGSAPITADRLRKLLS